MNAPIPVKVSKSHFDAAVKAQQKAAWLSSVCLVAQAIKGVFPRKKVSVGNSNATVGNREYTLSAGAAKLVLRFDSLTLTDPSKREKVRNAKFRASLPITVAITKV